MIDPFDTLGIQRRFNIDLREVEQRHRDLSRALHPDRYAQSGSAERRMAAERFATVNEALRVVKDPQARAAALLSAAGKPLHEESRAPTHVLMEILEARERLEAARAASEAAPQITSVRTEAIERVRETEQTIAVAFDGEATATNEQLAAAHEALVRLRYLTRLVEEADALLEEIV